MAGTELDEIDRAILDGLFENARRTRNEEIAQRAGVTHSTVTKRLQRLEEQGIITGYQPIIDYDEVGYPLQIVFSCGAPISKRDEYINAAMELDNVIKIRPLMAGQGNADITVVGESREDITRIAKLIDEVGFEIEGEMLVRGERYKLPSDLTPNRS